MKKKIGKLLTKKLLNFIKNKPKNKKKKLINKLKKMRMMKMMMMMKKITIKNKKVLYKIYKMKINLI
jgi:hypothetical protein